MVIFKVGVETSIFEDKVGFNFILDSGVEKFHYWSNTNDRTNVEKCKN